MPKELTHWILAERALAGLGSNSRLRGLIRNHLDCYLGGAVLPDTLLHLFRGPRATRALALATGFHDTAGNSFAPLIRAEQHLAGEIPEATLACLLGVITHMQADIVFHPFVYALAGNGGIGRHYRIETDIDVLLLRGGARPAVRHLAELMSPATRSVLLDTCALLFDPDGHLSRQELERALKLHCRFQGLYDRTSCKLAVRLAALLAGAPLREQQHLFYPLAGLRKNSYISGAMEWRHPFSGEQRQTSVDQLADSAVRRITTLFKRLEALGSLTDTLSESPGENLLTGMYGACLAVTKTKPAC
ncbi:MAG: zinc dependent phospholipase C family protein [Desulfobacteraceae bacterium]|nr:zinc dependent phospholipase C family protein [Desulfobacteraceae bacterium]